VKGEPSCSSPKSKLSANDTNRVSTIVKPQLFAKPKVFHRLAMPSDPCVVCAGWGGASDTRAEIAWFQHLKLKHGNLLSGFAFNVKLPP